MADHLRFAKRPPKWGHMVTLIGGPFHGQIAKVPEIGFITLTHSEWYFGREICTHYSYYPSQNWGEFVWKGEIDHE